MSMPTQELNAFESWYEENENQLMSDFIRYRDLLGSLIAYLDQMPRLSPIDYDDPQTIKSFIIRKYDTEFGYYCKERWLER